jgi:hypothetical protein
VWPINYIPSEEAGARGQTALAIPDSAREQAYDPVAGSLRLRSDKSRDDELRLISGKAARPEGHPCKWRGARPDLDASQIGGDASEEKHERSGNLFCSRPNLALLRQCPP